MSDENNNYNTSKNEEYVNAIDNIINDYKYQLAALKDKSTSVLKKAKQNSQNFIEDDNLKKQISNLEQEYYLKNDNFNIQLQNDNLRLQKENTSFKVKNSQLIENLKEKENLVKELLGKISLLEKEILECKTQLIEYEKNKMKEIEESKNKIKEELYNEMKKINEERNSNKKIIIDFFEFFNQNMDLYNKSQIINCGNSALIKYDEENKNNSNEQYSSFAISTLNNFINKIMGDNQEMFEELMKYKNIIDKQKNNINNNNINNNNINNNNISMDNINNQSNFDNNDDVKNRNLTLKKQLSNFFPNENKIENENNNKFDDSYNNNEFGNDYNNNNKLVKKSNEQFDNQFMNQNFNQFNNQQLLNNLNKNQNLNQFKNNQNLHVFNEYKKNIKNNFNNIQNIQNLDIEQELLNNKQFKYNENIIHTINSMNNINIPQKMNINYSNANITNKSNQTSVENSFLNFTNDISKMERNNIQQKIQQSQSFTGFEGPIQRLKMKISELENKIKSNNENDDDD
jgi:hypothetical protein